MPATTFTFICECFRCNGFKGAFLPFSGVNEGRCLRCNGGLRDVCTKPIARLEEYEPGAAKRRADTIATIAKVLGIMGAVFVAVGLDTGILARQTRALAATFKQAPAPAAAKGSVY